jgi:hypothetical protein
MYCAEKIEERLDQAEKLLKWRPVYHSVEEVESVTRKLDAIALRDSDGKPTGQPNRPYTDREKWWIRNERMLCACDASYFLTRYCFIKTEKNEIIRFTFRAPQKVYYKIISMLEKRGAAIQLQVLKARQLGMCLHPNTLVLTSDLRWIKIDDVQPGDVLIGVDEGLTQEEWKAQHAANMRLYRSGEPRPEKKNLPERKMRNTVVEAKREVFETAVRIKMEDGRELIATPQHRFLVKQRSGPQSSWKMVSELRPGDSIRHITGTWGEPTYEDGWFAGLFDGEGCVRTKNGIGIEACVAQVAGRVLDRAKKWLNDNKIVYREEIDNRRGGESSKLGNKPIHKLVISRMNEAFRLIGLTQPSRFAKDWWVGKSMPGKKSGDAFTAIESMEELPAQRMIDIQTSTKTFIAEGFVSHNSTITELLVAHRIIFTYGVNAIIASSAQQQTGIMAGMIFLAYDKLPFWMQPPPTRRSESEKGQLAFGGIMSGVSFQHGSQTTGIGRGSTPTVIHLSEVTAFPDPENLIEASLFRAVHESPNVFMILESTAEGVGNWWHKTWKLSKAGWHKGEARLCPLFLPWFTGTDIYPTPTWIETRPVPEGFRSQMIKETKAMMAKAKMFVKTDTLLSAVLGDDWEMGEEQAWYWQVNYLEYKGKGREKLWYQEMPGDDQECFQGSYDSVFGNELLNNLDQIRDRDYKIFAIVGHGIEDKFEPLSEDVDYSQPHKLVHYLSNKGDKFTWTFVPLLPETVDDEDEERGNEMVDGKLLIFREPEEGHDYTIGVDTGGGVGNDSTVIAVWRKGVRGMPDVQCAEFASAHLSHTEAYAFVMAIAAHYARYMRELVPREPLVSIEQIAAVGDTVQSQMRLMGYGRYFMWHNLDTKVIKKHKATRMGWRTSGWSRPILVNGFVNSVQNDWIHIHSPFLLREMSKFEVQIIRGREKLQHSSDAHDDRIFASAIAVYTSHDMEKMMERGKNKPIPMAKQIRPTLDLTPPGWTVSVSGDAIANTMRPLKTTQDLEDFIASERLMY